ncbi:MAG: hypothetical protein ACK58T_50590, partial [Phycisphaerae bacterium]
PQILLTAESIRRSGNDRNVMLMAKHSTLPERQLPAPLIFTRGVSLYHRNLLITQPRNELRIGLRGQQSD